MSKNQTFAVLAVRAVVVLLVATLCHADDPPKADSSLQIIQYKAPAGWKLDDKGAAHIFAAPDSNATEQAAILIILAPAQDRLDLATAFEGAIKEITGNRKMIESTDAVSTKTRQGFDAISRTFVAEGEGNQQTYARMVAANVQNRMAGIYFLANSKAMYDRHQADMAALLQSMTFNSGTVNPLGNNPANAAAELATLEKQKQELLAKVAQIEARQRELSGGQPPAARANATPQEERLTKAREQFATGIAARRKAHVVSGDILGLDGKPIANVVSYRISVWGTTVAAERTTYSLEVDQNGHYEQQVPDGLYQVEAHCIVTQSGHRVPVDLVWLDDKKQGVVQESAKGIVRDFRMVPNGPRPGEDPKSDRAYLGGTMRISGPPYTVTRGSFGQRYPGARLVVTFTPQCALVDGSKMDPIVVDMDPAEANYSSRRHNIPFAIYKCSAVLVAKDGTKTLLPCASNFDGPYSESAEIFWESSRDNPDQSTEPGLYLKD